MNGTLAPKRNFQVMAGAEWLKLLCKLNPDRYEQLVRYCSWYSTEPPRTDPAQRRLPSRENHERAAGR